MGGGEEGTLTEEEAMEREIARDPEVMKAQKRLRLKKIEAESEEEEARLAEVRTRRTMAERALKADGENGNGNGNGHKEKSEDDRLLKAIDAANAPLKEANAALQKRLDESDRRSSERESKDERRRELEAVTKPLQDAQAATQKMLETFMSKMGAPPSGPTPTEIMAKLDAMKAEIKSDTKDQITAAINQVSTAFTSKVDNLQTLMQSLKGKEGDPATLALISLATGGKGGSAEKDPFSQVDKLLTVLAKLKETSGAGEGGPPDFPSYLVEKMAETTPEVLNFFREQRGAIPSKEDIEKMMRGAAMKMYDGLNSSMKKELQDSFERLRGGQAPQIQQQPTPAAAPAASAPPAAAGPVASAGNPAPAPAPSITNFPGGGAPAPAAAPAAPAGPTGTMTPEALYKTLDEAGKKEYVKRVNWVLGGLLNEMKLGVREMQWPTKAHGNLPKPMIEQFVEAASNDDIYNIVKPYADVTVLEAIWKYVGPSNPQHEWYQEWLADGINWIKQAEGVELVEPEAEGPEPVVED